jgi:hypothetical protein
MLTMATEFSPDHNQGIQQSLPAVALVAHGGRRGTVHPVAAPRPLFRRKGPATSPRCYPLRQVWGDGRDRPTTKAQPKEYSSELVRH